MHRRSPKVVGYGIGIAWVTVARFAPNTVANESGASGPTTKLAAFSLVIAGV